MSDPEALAGAVFEALADATRRAVLRDVAERGPVTATELAADLPVTRQAIAKHLAVLREAGLVDQERAGRETRFSATPGPMADASQWLAATGAAWDDRLGRLAARLEQRARDGEAPAGRE
ncbi:MAG: ArsR/SmtB family transcription factor [Acidimicrobiales bacterium]